MARRSPGNERGGEGTGGRGREEKRKGEFEIFLRR